MNSTVQLTPRERAQLQHSDPPDPAKIRAQLGMRLSSIRTNIRELQRFETQLNAWFEFFDRHPVRHYSSDFHCYQIDDGEQHVVAARSEEEALRYYAITSGYDTVSLYLDDIGMPVSVQACSPGGARLIYSEDDGTTEVSTFAELANGVTKPVLVFTTCC